MNRWQHEFFDNLCNKQSLKESIEKFKDHFSDTKIDLYSPVLCYLYSVSQGKIYGSNFSNLLEVANHFLHQYSQYGDIFINVIEGYGTKEYILSLDHKGIFQKKLRNYYTNKPYQDTSYNDFLKILFFENEHKAADNLKLECSVKLTKQNEVLITKEKKTDSTKEKNAKEPLVTYTRDRLYPDKIPQENNNKIFKDYFYETKITNKALEGNLAYRIIQRFVFIVFLPLVTVLWAINNFSEAQKEKGVISKIIFLLKRMIAIVTLVIALAIAILILCNLVF